MCMHVCRSGEKGGRGGISLIRITNKQQQKKEGQNDKGGIPGSQQSMQKYLLTNQALKQTFNRSRFSEREV